VLGNRAAAKKTAQVIRKMARQEQDHLKAFDRLVNERRVRPTALAPIWHVAGFALGAATALLGEKAAMACTAAVEEVIDDHYASQIARIENDDDLKKRIEAFRADEIAHRDEALARGAEEAPGYRTLSATIKAGCRLAIKLSERI
jgi:ubiquinone biosynthesis monooxygenase Coq7